MVQETARRATTAQSEGGGRGGPGGAGWKSEGGATGIGRGMMGAADAAGAGAPELRCAFAFLA